MNYNLNNPIIERETKTVYEDNGNTIKLFVPNYSKSDILNEALNQARIENTGLNIPKIKSVTTFDNNWAIVSEYIKGKTLNELINKNPDKFDEYLDLFVDLQLKVQSTPAPQNLNNLITKMIKKISVANIDSSIKYDLNSRLQAMPVYKEICHCDFNPSNIIIAENNTPYIIDWAHVTAGNGAADAAISYILFWMDNNIYGAKKYLDLFCQKSNISKKHVQSWLPIVSASKSIKASPDEKEFLLSWINVVEYQ